MARTTLSINGSHKARRLIIVTVASLILIATPFVGLRIHSLAAHAEAVPDSCFAFDGAGTITGYNPNSNTSCGGDVDIPSSIDGIAVTAIGDGAFAQAQLSSVNIPDSVTSIGANAFAYNNLTSITIPASVTSIGNQAFIINNLSSVTVLGNPTLAGYSDNNGKVSNNTFSYNGNTGNIIACEGAYFSIGAPTDQDNATFVSCMQDNMNIVQIYAPNASADNASLASAIYNGYLYALDSGSINVYCPTGGQVLNPAQLKLNYLDDNNQTLASSQTLVGPSLTSYSVSSNPTGDMSQYFTAGQSYTFKAPTINGYTAPTDQTTTLRVGDGSSTPTNELTAIYKKVSSSANNSAGTNFAAPNTGDTDSDLPVGCVEE